ncbi:MAG TPA: glycine cleavage system aminomethyltransferase GcvT [Candidatus Omnitrophota bacterium]|nr:glycine cleavage system aminomethyltransferase GcvT [Candidatus Omnitrophota bacterium]
MKRTPLYEKHLSSGAKMVDFAGWEMPVYYSGILEEHLHTRSRAGLFDICHMGEFFFKGKDAQRELDKLVTCRLDDMPDGKCRYGFFLSDDGGILDDLIVFRFSREEFMVVVNAGTIEKDRSWVSGKIKGNVDFSDRSDLTAKLDVQGPASQAVMVELAGKDAVLSLKRYSFTNVKIDGVDVILGRTGYTGEIGYELFFDVPAAPAMWDRLMAFPDIKPIGLGARDTLRLEMGYPLYGSDIYEEVTPLDANLGRFVFMEKDFTGREALLKRKPDKVLTGFLGEGRRVARHGFSVVSGGKVSGVVTSGAFSPCMKRAIGLCYVDKNEYSPGREVTLTDGKVSIQAVLENVPLLKRGLS